jgi:hypothetical protein
VSAFGRNFLYRSSGIPSGDLTLSGNLTMAAGKQIIADAGTAAAPGVAIGSADTGIHAASGNPAITRGGSNAFLVSGSNVSMISPLISSNDELIQRGLQVDPEAVKAVNYQVTDNDVVVIMNGAGLTATLPAAPATSQMVWIKNIDGGTCTVARNSKNIDGAASDITLAARGSAGDSCLLIYNGTAWYRLSR